MKSVFKVTFAYLAAIIGAGFASGSEVLIYFVRYGKLGIIGIFLTSVLFGAIIYCLLSACVNKKIYSFDLLSRNVLSKWEAIFADVIMVIFMIIILGAMISAFSEMMWILWGIKKSISSVLFAVLCAFILLLPGHEIIKWGGVLGLFIVAFICICSIYMINFRTVKVFSSTAPVIISSVVYTGYNAFAVCPVICSAAKDLKSISDCKYVGVLSSIFSFLALALIWCLLMVYYGKINLDALPMITLASRQGIWFRNIYVVVVVAAVLSSAVANAYGVYLKLPKKITNTRSKIIAVLLPGWLVASVSFTQIVDKLYRSVGMISVFILGYFLLKIKKNGEFKCNNEKTEDN